MMKNWKISLMIVTMTALVSMSFAQSYVVDTARLERAENRLIELESVDKRQLTKAEKRAWKRERKMQKQIIAQEMEKVRFNQEMEHRWRYGNGYPFYPVYGFANPVFGFGNFQYGRFYRRPVIIRQQNCVVPSRPRARARN